MAYGASYVPGDTKADYRWWTAEEGEYHGKVVEVAEWISSKDDIRRQSALDYMRLYGNLELFGLEGNVAYQRANPERITLNVIKACIDAVTAKIAKNKPKATFLTEGGDYSLRKRAKQLEKFVDGQFYISGMYKLAPRIFLDACVFGTGILKVYEESGKLCMERVYPGEVLVDFAEAVYGQPQQIFQKKYVNRDVLIELYPDYENELRKAKGPSTQDFGVDTCADQVIVWEAWHLPSGPEAEDGRHCIVVDNATLFEEEYSKDHFPFVFIRWSEPLRGFWGEGLAEELIGIQVEINRLLIKIQKAFHLLAVPRVFINQASKVNKTSINNMIGAIVPYTGEPPVVLSPQTIHPEVFAHLDRLYERSFEIAGISQMSVGGTLPTGVDRASGKALTAHHDIETERFAVVGQHYEDFFLDAAKLVISMARDIAERDGDFVVTSQKDKFTIEKIEWNKIDLDADAYVLKCYPTSVLPDWPSGRYAQVQEMFANGDIDSATKLRLLDMPDLDNYLSLEAAASDDIDAMIENMIDEGIYESPEPYQDLQLLLKRFQAAYLKYRRMGVAEDRLAMLRDATTQAHEMIKATMVDAQSMGPPMPGSQPPMGADGASPMAAGPTPPGGPPPAGP